MSKLLMTASTVTLSITAIAAGPAQATALSTLPPGTAYRYVFTTNDTTTAVSTDIATYNTFVTTEAALNTALAAATWTAIGSTDTVAATANASCGTDCDANVPLFTIDGTEVAASLNDLFANNIMNNLAVDQYGNAAQNEYVWTGSNSDGSASTPYTLGTGAAIVGDNQYAPNSLDDFPNSTGSTQFALYGISSELETAGAAPLPEPASLLLFLFGGLSTALFRRKSHPAAEA